MKTIKLKIIANNSQWATFDTKITRMKEWFSSAIKLEIDLEHTAHSTIPFSQYTNVEGVVYYGIESKWYDKNVSINAVGYDIVMFVVNHDQWKENNRARGWRMDRTFGPVELQICADENKTAAVGTSGTLDDEFFGYGRHEIMHALYMLTGQEDRTHYLWDRNELELGLKEIKFPEPKGSIERTIYFAPGVLQWFINLLKSYMTISKLDNWAEAIKEHEGWFSPSTSYPNGSKSFRNNNPGNLRYVGQLSATGADKTGFCIFPDYATGLEALKTMLRNAGSGKSRVYHKEMTLLDFFKVYAPSFDDNNPERYAGFVAERIGVSINTQINTLI